MPDDRNLLYGGLHIRRQFYYPRQTWITVENALKELGEDAFDFPINQIVNLELIKTTCLFQLPCAWSADNNLWLVLFNYRVRHNSNELVRINRQQVFTTQF